MKMFQKFRWNGINTSGCYKKESFVCNLSNSYDNLTDVSELKWGYNSIIKRNIVHSPEGSYYKLLYDSSNFNII